MANPLLNNLITTKDFNSELDNLEIQIGFFGGRRVVDTRGLLTGSLCINDLFKMMEERINAGEDPTPLTTAFGKINRLDFQGQTKLKNARFFQRILTVFKSFVGSFFYNRGTAYYNLQNKLLDASAKYKSKNSLNSKTKNTRTAPSIPVSFAPLSKEAETFLDKNPFIHGTSSTIFAHLPSTDQKLLPLDKLLKRKRAPLGGEIFLGGTDCIIAKGKTSFGRVKGGSYPLERVLRSYAIPPSKDELEINVLARGLVRALENNFFTQALLAALRAKQAGIKLGEGVFSFPQEYYLEFINTYALIPFFLKFVTPPEGFRVDKFSLDNFKTFLIENKIDLAQFAFAKKIDLSDSNMQKIVGYLKEKNLQVNAQAAEKSSREVSYEEDPAGCPFQISISQFNTDRIDQMFSNCFYHRETMLSRLDTIEKKYHKFIDEIKNHIDLIQSILTTEEDLTLKLSPEDEELVKQPFGLILFSDTEDCMKWNKSEYRSTRPVALGKEIKMIAVDNVNIPKMKSYLERYHIEGVEVVAIEALKKKFTI